MVHIVLEKQQPRLRWLFSAADHNRFNPHCYHHWALWDKALQAEKFTSHRNYFTKSWRLEAQEQRSICWVLMQRADFSPYLDLERMGKGTGDSCPPWNWITSYWHQVPKDRIIIHEFGKIWVSMPSHLGEEVKEIYITLCQVNREWFNACWIHIN